MTEISAQLVKELREKTGAGMMDCKKALKESNGDLEGAVDVLRKSGIAKAAKKAGRSATEGIITAIANEKGGAIIELLCETDFVSKNEKFIAYADQVVKQLSECGCEGNVSEKLAEKEKDNVVTLVATIGENIQLRRAARWHGKCASYLHMGGRIGVMIEYTGSGSSESLTDICMHIAAFNPTYVCPEEIPAAVLEREKEIHMAQLEGKPAEMIAKILPGKISKWHKDICLNEQPWIRDDKKSVKQANPGVTVTRFVRWAVGEEI